MDPNTLYVIIALIIAAVIGIVVALIWYFMTPYYKWTKCPVFDVIRDSQKRHLISTTSQFNKLPGTKRFAYNVHFPLANGSTAVADIVMINESGIYVVDCKNYYGTLSGDEVDEVWYYEDGKKKHEIKNPAIWNKLFIKWLKGYITDLPQLTSFYSYFVVPETCDHTLVHLKTKNTTLALVTNFEMFILRDSKLAEISLSITEMDSAWEKINALKTERSALAIKDVQGIQDTIFYSTSSAQAKSQDATKY